MIYDIIYENARKRLDRLTPLPFDCGKLCGGTCCKGDKDTGMYLFPFEENFYKNRDGVIIEDSELTYSDDSPVKFICCTKPCKRHTRPLSCRIFPLFPYFKKNSSLKVMLDPRAKGLCPLLYPEASGYIQKKFYSEVELLGRYLAKTNKGADFLESVSCILDDYLKLKG